MKTLRNSKVLALFGVLALMLAVTLVAAPTADAGCGYGGHGYGGYGYSSYYAPVATHYVAPPTYYAPPVYQSTYFAPAYYGHGCHYGW